MIKRRRGTQFAFHVHQVIVEEWSFFFFFFQHLKKIHHVYINDNYKDTYITHSHSLTNAHTLNLQEVPANQPTKKRLSVHTFFFHMDIYVRTYL